METIDHVLMKIKEVRQEKGLSHENMADELGISQGAYTNIEKNASRLTVERLMKISEILERPVYHFFEIQPNNIYNQCFYENSFGGHIENLFQDNREAYKKLAHSYEGNIENLKNEIEFLRKNFNGN